MKILELKIEGMTCGGCSASVENLIDKLEGIRSRNIDHQTDSGMIEFDDNVISKEDIIKKINEGHYKVAGYEDLVQETKQETPPCPSCNIPGEPVPNTVFRSNLRSKYFSWINTDVENYICMDSDCDTAYYNSYQAIDMSALKRELWFKKDSKRKIICYCNNIDTEQIRETVQQKQLYSWEDINAYYRKKVIERCEVLNPTGTCCRELFDEVVSEFKL